MKELMEILPTLTASIKGKVLIIYLVALTESISAVLLAEREKRQVPIYFVSRVLQGAELNYPRLEKLILDLQTLADPEKSGRIAKWAIELGEHDIEVKGRDSVKGQIPANFLVETPPTEDNEKEISKVGTKKEGAKLENMWKLYTDGASSSDGSGAGLMLISPEGKEYTYTLRFEFETANNEVEYEALLAGLRIAREMEIKILAIFVDSQLIANRVKGLFEARQPTIKQYLKKTKEILMDFDTYSMEHLRRNQNKKANTLSKLASMTFEHLTKEVLVEVIAKHQ
ncbi:reverse transcriptase domain-containing protein [Tanacetum coccineum]